MSVLPVIVLGAGGHAKVVVDALLAQGREILGLTALAAGGQVLGRPVLGDDTVLTRHAPSAVELAVGIGSVAQPQLRFQLFQRFRISGYRFATVIHPGAIIGHEVLVEEGAQIMAGAVIQPGVRVGANAIVNTGAMVDHDGVIGAHCHIAPGATLSGSVRIGERSHLGTGAVVIQGITIGAEVVVGAGALILADVPPGTKVLGVWSDRGRK